MKTVLVVDDQPHVHTVLRECFQEMGLHVDSARCGLEGLILAKTLTPDVIFLDIHIPDFNGIEILKMLRVEVPQSTVVMMSGVADEETAREAIHLGAWDYIEEPFDLEYIKDIFLTKLALTH